MNSEELAKVLVDQFRGESLKYYNYTEITRSQLDKLEYDIAKLLLYKFEEGVHVGRDHYEKV